MMNVQTMRRIVDEIQGGAMPEVATAAAARWNGSSVTHVRSGANHVFRFSQDGQPRYLRLTPASERQRGAIGAELDFVLHTAAAGLVVARPLPSAHGALIEEVLDGGERCFAVAFEALRGEHYEWDELEEPMYRAWGRALGRLHQASETLPVHLARPTWQQQMRALLGTVPPHEDRIAGILASGLAWLDTLPARDHGLLHGDFELDNLVWDGEQPQILDFDAAVYTWYAVDIAIALADVWSGAAADRDRRSAWFFNGYAQVRPLPDGVQDSLPRLLSLLSAFKMAQLLQAYATTDDEHSPEWLTRMHARHRAGLSARRAALPLRW